MTDIKLMNQLWQLWEDLAESGELHIDKKFISRHNHLRIEVENLSLQCVSNQRELLLAFAEFFDRLTIKQREYPLEDIVEIFIKANNSC